MPTWSPTWLALHANGLAHCGGDALPRASVALPRIAGERAHAEGGYWARASSHCANRR
ncbi:hypothetical protein BURKHO8Y_60048 [Burkholderia sp. 8Y]|nr:hypothetical protein BURKHO8Y_60048 [Burkholderia sp. 8Y]